MVNPVAAGANLFAQLISIIPVSVRALYFLVLTLCAFFFLLHIVLKVMR